MFRVHSITKNKPYSLEVTEIPDSEKGVYEFTAWCVLQSELMS